MLPSNHIALKEWAAVCEALGEGRQILIARKGGIHEGREGFRVEHREFWLFPTYVHEQEEGLVEDARPLHERAGAARPREGLLRIAHYAIVTDVFELRDERQAALLAGRHVWVPRVLADRFAYRTPGLFVLLVRVLARPSPLLIPDSPHLAGCRSWVELPSALSTQGLVPVVPEGEFEQRRAAIATLLASPETA